MHDMVKLPKRVDRGSVFPGPSERLIAAFAADKRVRPPSATRAEGEHVDENRAVRGALQASSGVRCGTEQSRVSSHYSRAPLLVARPLREDSMTSSALRSVLGLSLLLSLGAAGCSSGAKDSTSATTASSIVGDWVTEKTPSQLGTMVTRYQFGKDGDFHGRVEFVDSPMPPIVVAGRYVVRGSSLDTKIDDQTRTSTFRFDKDELILEQNGNVLRFHRK